MTRAEAIIALMAVPKWAGKITAADALERIECLKALGVTRAELIEAKKLAEQTEINTLRAEAAAKEAALPTIDV